MPFIIVHKDQYESESPSFFSIQGLQNQYRYYPLASAHEVWSDLSGNSFKRCIQENSFLYDETVKNLDTEPKFSFFENDLKPVLYKMQLKEQLQNERIDFDSYRAGELGNLNTPELKKCINVGNTSRINIHESDFHDFRLKSLEDYSSYRYDPENYKSYCPKYYNCSEKETEAFKTYMTECFLFDLNNMCIDSDFRTKHFDPRLSYDQVFEP